MKDQTKRTAQFIRTDKAIVQAMIRLLKDHSFEKITVQDILEETPVTRTTFYAHFRDKYEIAERMQEEYKEQQKQILADMGQESKTRYPALIKAAVNRNRDLIEALLKIHTDTVDLRGTLVKELEEAYLSSSSSPTRRTEAAVYAQALTTFEFSYLTEHNDLQFTSEYVDQVMTEVFMNILKINDPVTKDFLHRRIAENLNSSPES